MRAHGLVVVQFPHFAQNFQQRALFVCDAATESALLAEKPGHAKYAAGARLMQEGLLVEIKAVRS